MPNMHSTKTYQELEMLLGREAADKMVAAYRGQEIHIPYVKSLPESHNLVKILGLEVAKRLCHYWGGTRLSAPMQYAKTIEARNSAIVKKYKSGIDSNALATEYGISSRQVRNIITQHNNAKAKQVYERMQYQLFER